MISQDSSTVFLSMSIRFAPEEECSRPGTIRFIQRLLFRNFLFFVFCWTDIVSVSAGNFHTVRLKSDGTVVAKGSDIDGECDVCGWKDIVAASAGVGYTVGLKRDGTVVAVGDKRDGDCNVSGWTDIVAVSTGFWHTVGLNRDGTVVAVGNNEYGQCDVGDWTGIKLPSDR